MPHLATSKLAGSFTQPGAVRASHATPPSRRSRREPRVARVTKLESPFPSIVRAASRAAEEALSRRWEGQLRSLLMQPPPPAAAVVRGFAWSGSYRTSSEGPRRAPQGQSAVQDGRSTARHTSGSSCFKSSVSWVSSLSVNGRAELASGAVSMALDMPEWARFRPSALLPPIKNVDKRSFSGSQAPFL